MRRIVHHDGGDVKLREDRTEKLQVSGDLGLQLGCLKGGVAVPVVHRRLDAEDQLLTVHGRSIGVRADYLKCPLQGAGHAIRCNRRACTGRHRTCCHQEQVHHRDSSHWFWASAVQGDV